MIYNRKMPSLSVKRFSALRDFYRKAILQNREWRLHPVGHLKTHERSALLLQRVSIYFLHFDKQQDVRQLV